MVDLDSFELAGGGLGVPSVVAMSQLARVLPLSTDTLPSQIIPG